MSYQEKKIIAIKIIDHRIKELEFFELFDSLSILEAIVSGLDKESQKQVQELKFEDFEFYLQQKFPKNLKGFLSIYDFGTYKPSVCTNADMVEITKRSKRHRTRVVVIEN